LTTRTYFDEAIDRILVDLLVYKRGRVRANNTTLRDQVLEAVQKANEAVHGQMTRLAAQAEKWRAAATYFNVCAALISFPEIQVNYLRVAEKYEGLAARADQAYWRYVSKWETALGNNGILYQEGVYVNKKATESSQNEQDISLRKTRERRDLYRISSSA
jgi:hypothetical protein